MASPELTRGRRVHEAEPAGRADDDLPTLVARLGDDVASLLDSKLALLKLDVEERVHGYADRALGWSAAAAAVGVGVTLVAVGLGFGVAYLLPARLDPSLARAIAFGAIGVVLSAAGALVLRRGLVR